MSLFEAMADGKEITIVLKSGETVEAELIAVRLDALLITQKIGASDRRLREDSTSIERLPREQIVRITVEGKSYVGIGALIGLPVGALAGALIGASAADEPKNTGEAVLQPLEQTGRAVVGGIYGGLGGLLLGLVVGGVASERDQDIQPSQLAKLREFARYAETEPEFLKTRFRSDSMEENRNEGLQKL